ncbi:hypothetical protein N4562_10585 [Ligilactobacillus agilis]|uniref:Uncharacterized protein n=1 Tax=Ligilactobacillus agilis TaxID=1601 RepID=A0A9Q9N0E3_9LACO|nr:hypothetical protein [Ligilactobacillus agilis]UXC63455.1 hypothetical protein N4562_10585 [Ligilactobacillus agilis]UXC65454.1 hypothetical protein N4597_10580 [Ligilactobacillus agilis]
MLIKIDKNNDLLFFKNNNVVIANNPGLKLSKNTLYNTKFKKHSFSYMDVALDDILPISNNQHDIEETVRRLELEFGNFLNSGLLDSSPLVQGSIFSIYFDDTFFIEKNLTLLFLKYYIKRFVSRDAISVLISDSDLSTWKKYLQNCNHINRLQNQNDLYILRANQKVDYITKTYTTFKQIKNTFNNYQPQFIQNVNIFGPIIGYKNSNYKYKYVNLFNRITVVIVHL